MKVKFTVGLLSFLSSAFVSAQSVEKTMEPSVVINGVFALSAIQNNPCSSPPERPQQFRNQEELQAYLRALAEWMVICGRP